MLKPSQQEQEQLFLQKSKGEGTVSNMIIQK